MGQWDDSSLQRTLGQMLERAMHPEKPMNEIGLLMVQRMKKNFSDQASVVPWPMSKRAEKRGGETLRDTGTLMNSIVYEADGSSIAAGPTAVGRDRLTDPRILAALDLGTVIRQYARSDVHARRRRLGKFTRGVGKGHGMTFGERTIRIFPYHYTFVPSDVFVSFGEIMRAYLFGGPIIRAGSGAQS